MAQQRDVAPLPERPYVFLSVASEDVEIARAVKGWLQIRGVRCWLFYDHVGPASDDATWDEHATRALANSAATAVFWSASAARRGKFVRREFGWLALEENRRLHEVSVLRLDDEPSSTALAMAAARRLDASDVPEALEWLEGRLRQHPELRALLEQRPASQSPLDAACLRLRNVLAESAPAARATAGRVAPPRNPYKGFSAYAAGDPGFFARDTDVGALAERLRSATLRMLAVTGSSGVGKSSLVRCGLATRLSVLVDPRWQVLEVAAPGRRPLRALAEALAGLPEVRRACLATRDAAEAQLADDPCALARWSREARTARPDERCLLLVDQAEELFSVAQDDDAARFLELAAAAALERDGALHVVLTVRHDFTPELEAHPALESVVNQAENWQYLVRPIDGSDLETVIRGPAEQVGVRVDDALVDVVLGAGGRSGQSLPLLSYALAQVFTRMTQRGPEDDGRWCMRREDLAWYAGGKRGVASHAEAGLEGLVRDLAEPALERVLDGAADVDEADRAVDALLARLVDVRSDDGDPTRQRAARQDFEALPLGRAFVAAFADPSVRLLELDEATVSVAHERLFTAWPRLCAFIDARIEDYRALHWARVEGRRWARAGHAPLAYTREHARVLRAREACAALGVSCEQLAREHPEAARLLHPEADLRDRLTDRATTVPARAYVGEVQDALGDVAPGMGLDARGLPDIEWVRVEAGRVVLEEEAEPRGAFEVAPFWMARYPVTYAQFRAFKDAEDFADVTWWADFPQSQARIIIPQPRPLAHEPRVNVSWYDAVAFCRWLTAHGTLPVDGGVVRLPDEWEWQHAASGGAGTSGYPWGGGECESFRANVKEAWTEGYTSAEPRLTAVGLFPAGRCTAWADARGVGVLDDLAGNVWEWCRNGVVLGTGPGRIGQPEGGGDGCDDDSGGARALRGGAWSGSAGRARCAIRDHNDPRLTGGGVGFRVICALPIEEH